jgi:hypothetical protein
MSRHERPKTAVLSKSTRRIHRRFRRRPRRPGKLLASDQHYTPAGKRVMAATLAQCEETGRISLTR